jgi:hypothetical protein
MHASSISLIPPGTGGVRDYASLLSDAIGAPLFELGPQTRVDGLSGDLLCLHFSGYGFQKRGVPMWLVQAIRGMQPRFRRVGIVFHELFAPSGPPWGSAFWLAGMQKRIARDLLGLADFWVTSREESARWLLGSPVRRVVPHRVLPIFSSVGEPESIDTPRKDKLVVFGSAGVRANVYQWSDGEVFRCAERNGLQLHDIGPPFEGAQSAIAERVSESGGVVHGKLPADAVSTVLSEAKFGVLAYPIDYVAKSSVFAAFCAHGVCPVLLSHGYETHDGLVANQHYARGFDVVDAKALDPAQIGRDARTWYEPHRMSVHQATFRSLAEEARR